MARSSEGRSSLSRAVDVLDAFDSASVHLTVSAVAARTGMPLSSTHGLLAELERLGLVERSPDRTYQLGVRLWEWAARTPGAAGLRSAARPHLQHVHHLVRQHVQLGVLRGTDVVFVERLSAPDAVVNYTMIGGRTPALLSSSGLAQVAFLAAEDRDAVVDGARRQGQLPAPLADPGVLRRRLAAIRREGHVVTDGYVHPAARGVAVPLLGARGEVLGAVSVVVPNDDAPARPLVNVLRAAAARIVRDLAAAQRPTPAG
ncbi:IclR family transcriptional regulator [Citricoccus sp. SGAir0253]|uniref:IclR family transcriptional regulator n=1 Tax=Citricoccus sp. SGAir0253 TaxID=2567881 RepID=UPI00143D777C|nr:IclR family transcriptional regulator [Citricoccus sp. SGAir0253]